MSLLSLNFEGLGLLWNVRFLTEIVRQERPIFIFPCETLSRKDKLEFKRCKLGFEGFIIARREVVVWRCCGGNKIKEKFKVTPNIILMWKQRLKDRSLEIDRLLW